jgi:hypothetical protein
MSGDALDALTRGVRPAQPAADLGQISGAGRTSGRAAGRRTGSFQAGGDSALEAAAEIADKPDSKVILSYRGNAFSRARQRNRERVADADRSRLQLAPGTEVAEIRREDVGLSIDRVRKRAATDDVITCAGGVRPNDFLRGIGITVETKFGAK